MNFDNVGGAPNFDTNNYYRNGGAPTPTYKRHDRVKRVRVPAAIV